MLTISGFLVIAVEVMLVGKKASDELLCKSRAC
jgi:hypothetical protein